MKLQQSKSLYSCSIDCAFYYENIGKNRYTAHSEKWYNNKYKAVKINI